MRCRVERAAPGAPPCPALASATARLLQHVAPAVRGRPGGVTAGDVQPTRAPWRWPPARRRGGVVATTTAGARAAATSATAFCPAWVTTTSAAHSVRPQVRRGPPRAALGPRPVRGRRRGGVDGCGVGVPTRPRPRGGATRRLAAGAAPADGARPSNRERPPTRPGLARPRRRPVAGVRLRGPRREEGVGEVVGGAVRPVGPLAGEGDDHDGRAAQPGQECDLDGHVDHHRGRAFARRPGRERAPSGHAARGRAAGPSAAPPRGDVVTRGRRGVVVARQLHPVAGASRPAAAGS